MIGAPGRIRTHDPQIRSLVLYPAELPVLKAKAACARGRRRRSNGALVMRAAQKCKGFYGAAAEDQPARSREQTLLIKEPRYRSEDGFPQGLFAKINGIRSWAEPVSRAGGDLPAVPATSPLR